MRARIALLEGEKRGNEGAMRDLGRRCKMLENALRGERSKFLSTTNALASASAAGATPSASGTSSPVQTASAPAATTKLNVPTSADMAPSTSSPGITVSSTPGQAQPTAAAGSAHVQQGSRASSSLGINGTGSGTGTWGASAAAGRDPRGRARSRDYLKQCLQEITYLTSSTTLNPLAPTSHSAPNIPRPRKTLPDLPPPTSQSNSHPPSSQPGLITLPSPLPPLHLESPSHAPPPLISQSQGQSASASALTNFPSDPASAFVPLKRQISQPLPAASSDPLSPPSLPPTTPAENSSTSTSRVPAPSPPTTADNDSALPPSSPAASAIPLPSLTPTPTTDEPAPPNPFARRGSMSDRGIPAQNGTAAPDSTAPEGEDDESGPPGSRLTAIFRPESDEAWRAQLRSAGEQAAKGPSALAESQPTAAAPAPGAAGEEDLDDLRWEDVDDQTEEGRKKMAFGDEGLSLVSGGDDMCVKLWRLDPRALNSSNSRSAPETEPVMTFRAHTSSVTSVLLSSSHGGRIYSGSLDSTINVWALPPVSSEPYGPFDPSLHLASLAAHSNAVWALALVGPAARPRLASAGADGAVKIWDIEQDEPILRTSWDYGEPLQGKRKKGAPSPAPTSLAAVGTDRVAVAYQDSVVKIFEIETGKEVMRLKSDQSFDGTPGTQINHLVAHPTLPIIVTAHEDKYIRVFSTETGECTRSQITHLDGVTSLALDPTGTTLVSVGHDTSLRFWDLASLTCVREVAAHRNKQSEGILDVKFHAKLQVVATAGADGTVKLWG
ncbi:hypothetical protein RQP46_007771 [Phenoliferia psychrophenolica]